jgi:hypothetical protein
VIYLINGEVGEGRIVLKRVEKGGLGEVPRV